MSRYIAVPGCSCLGCKAARPARPNDESERKLDLIDFAKTGAPPAPSPINLKGEVMTALDRLLDPYHLSDRAALEGVSDHAWVESLPTYAAVDNDRRVPRMQDQSQWLDQKWEPARDGKFYFEVTFDEPCRCPKGFSCERLCGGETFGTETLGDILAKALAQRTEKKRDEARDLLDKVRKAYDSMTMVNIVRVYGNANRLRLVEADYLQGIVDRCRALLDAKKAESEEPYSSFVARLFSKRHEGMDGFLHAALGMSGEAGEIVDAVKKTWVYGKTLDRENLIEELGDIVFYVVAMCNALGITLSDAIDGNRTKLNKRYPQGYSDAAAIARADKQES